MVKSVIALCAIVASVNATQSHGLPNASAVEKFPYQAENLNEMYNNQDNLYSNSWDGYKKTRQLMVDCDVYESENWLGMGRCKYSWECRGARMCEGQGWCYGDDACEEIHE